MRQGKMLDGGLAALERELEREQWAGTRYFIVADSNTFEQCLPRVIDEVEALCEADFVEVPVGEECKCMEVVEQVWQTMMETGVDRQTVVVNLGGGSVTDLGGFVASTYMRGLRTINIPTTLLGMVDAAIGGKTAIDYNGVKNSIGTFHPAELTVIETSLLATLPAEATMDGMMEMVKTAVVTDPAVYASLLAIEQIDKRDIVNIARRKRRIVEADPTDNGIRHILNFGHTFGHAIEMHCGMSHGMAVGIGMLAEMYLSTKKTGLREGVLEAYERWLRARVTVPKFTLRDAEQMLGLMRHDKKNSNGETACVLLQEVGAAVIGATVTDNEVRDALLHV